MQFKIVYLLRCYRTPFHPISLTPLYAWMIHRSVILTKEGTQTNPLKMIRYKSWTENESKTSQCPKKNCRKPSKPLLKTTLTNSSIVWLLGKYKKAVVQDFWAAMLKIVKISSSNSFCTENLMWWFCWLIDCLHCKLFKNVLILKIPRVIT